MIIWSNEVELLYDIFVTTAPISSEKLCFDSDKEDYIFELKVTRLIKLREN